tara:strand:- start:85 stop:264 length:180 start_codon:yes stop_codon:yes gene_type:complete
VSQNPHFGKHCEKLVNTLFMGFLLLKNALFLSLVFIWSFIIKRKAQHFTEIHLNADSFH